MCNQDRKSTSAHSDSILHLCPYSVPCYFQILPVLLHAGSSENAGPELEASAIVPICLGEETVSATTDKESDHISQGSFTLTAHKTGNYICHRIGCRAVRTTRIATSNGCTRQETLDSMRYRYLNSTSSRLPCLLRGNRMLHKTLSLPLYLLLSVARKRPFEYERISSSILFFLYACRI